MSIIIPDISSKCVTFQTIDLIGMGPFLLTLQGSLLFEQIFSLFLQCVYNWQSRRPCGTQTAALSPTEWSRARPELRPHTVNTQSVAFTYKHSGPRLCHFFLFCKTLFYQYNKTDVKIVNVKREDIVLEIVTISRLLCIVDDFSPFLATNLADFEAVIMTDINHTRRS